MASFEIEIDGVDKTLRAIKRDLHRGMEKSSNRLVDQARNHARGVISEERAVVRDCDARRYGNSVACAFGNELIADNVRIDEDATTLTDTPNNIFTPVYEKTSTQ